MKHVQIFEDFKQGLMAKPQGFLSRLAQGAKHAMGMEKKEDREALESIHRAFKADSEYMSSGSKDRWINNVREIKPGVIVGYIDNRPLTVNQTIPEIYYMGRNLDLHNIQDEVDFLYKKLKNKI
jgi:hypothetical protein